MSPETRDEKRLRRFLASIASLASLGIAFSALAWVLHLTVSIVGEPVISSDGLAGLGMLFVVSWISSADVRRYRPYIRILVGALALNSIIFLLSALRLSTALQAFGSVAAAIVFGGLAIGLG